LKKKDLDLLNKENWLANSDEYSVYSDSTISQALSVHGNSLRRVPRFGKRNSVLAGKEVQKSVFEKLKRKRSRRMTIMDPNLLVNRAGLRDGSSNFRNPNLDGNNLN